MVSKNHDQFLQRLRETFKVEALEQLETMSAGIAEFEASTERGEWPGILEKIFRAAHSLKGAARAVEHGDIESLCQLLENVFAAWRKRGSKPSLEALDTIQRAIDCMGVTITPAEQEAQASPAALAAVRRSLSQLLTVPLSSGSSPPFPYTNRAAIPPRPAEPESESSLRYAEQLATTETVRVPVAKLESSLMLAEELVTAKILSAQHIVDLYELLAGLRNLRESWSVIEPDARRVRHLQAAAATEDEGKEIPDLRRLLDAFDQGLEKLRLLESKAETLRQKASRNRRTVGRLVDDVVDDSKRFLLLPFATLSAYFAKIVRDLCRDQKKQADFTIRGEDIEIDKRILEELKDPLVHLLRNSVDHGIEMPHERLNKGKPSRAKIVLTVTQTGSNSVQLSLEDDGAGINAVRVKESAIASGALSEQEAQEMDEKSAQQLIFRSKISTSPIITDLSGRGMGLAIVSERAEKLGGKVVVESTAGKGTLFRIDVPTVRAAFRGVLVDAADRSFFIPTAHVVRVVRVPPEEIRTVEGRETIRVDGRAAALVWLSDVLELPANERHAEAPSSGWTVVILGAGETKVAFVVDAIGDEQEILMRPLQKPLSRVRNVAGAAVLGSGQVVPVLNVPDLLSSARRHGLRLRTPAMPEKKARESAAILVAEDSITSRMLLKGILESAGYRVKTAVDGLDAFTALREEKFDLLVSDVEMPRLNGFDLTARIRADNKLAELPVVLVTALEKREDRERGIEVGSNAYIVKRSFDQSNLLEAVKRLV